MEHAWQFGRRDAPPSPQNMQSRAFLLNALQSGVPGYPTDDRYLQSQKFTGIVYTAIRPLMRAVRKANVVCYRRVRKRNGRTTFGPGGSVAKSMSAVGGKGQRDDYVPVDADHPVARVLDRPQGDDGVKSIGDILEYAALQAQLTGVSPLWCVPSKRYLAEGEWRPVQLYALPTALTVPQPASASLEYPDGLYRIAPYYATPTGGGGFFPGRSGGIAGTTLDGREVKRRMFAHPLYLWDGYSPLTAAAFLLDIAEAVDQARWSAMNSGVNPDIIMSITGATADVGQQVKDSLIERNGGSRKNRQPMVLTTPMADGEIKYDLGNRSPKEMDFKDSWVQVTDAVFGVFGIPRSLVFGGSNYAEMYAAEKFYHKNTVRPECDGMGEFLTTALAMPWEEEPGELCIEVEPQEPQNEEVAVISAKDRVELDLVTYNEARASQNLPPLPGGDVLPSVFKQKAGIAAGTAPDPTKPPESPPGKGKPAPGDTPTGGAPPRPENDEAEGSKPPLTKAIPRDAEFADPAPYGFCPECRTPGISAERRINGNAHCANGHAYPRKKAKYASTQIELTGPAAKKLRAFARAIPDADLGEDGREDDPHVTARYGLHATGPEPVASVVAGFGPVRYRLGRLSAFRGAETGKDYDVIFAEVESPDLHRLHAALGVVPHTDTWPDYKPHATVAYVKAGLADKYLANLGAVDTDGQTDALTFSTADRQKTTIPLSGVMAKAMSTLSDPAGGALVAPAMVGGKRYTRRASRRKLARLVRGKC